MINLNTALDINVNRARAKALRGPTAVIDSEYTGKHFIVCGESILMFETMGNGNVGVSYAPEGDFGMGPAFTLSRDDARTLWSDCTEKKGIVEQANARAIVDGVEAACEWLREGLKVAA